MTVHILKRRVLVISILITALGLGLQVFKRVIYKTEVMLSSDSG